MADYCAICGCDSFECGGGVTGVCIRADGGPYCARVEKEGHACGEPAATCSRLRADLARLTEAEHSAVQRGNRLAQKCQDLEAETTRLRERVEKAIDYANGRWGEWGERAETVRDMLESALTSDPEPTT